MTRTAVALVTLLLVACPAAALAQAPQKNAPPGNSAIDEYLETVPGAAGDRSPRSPDGASGALTPAQRARLEQLGPDGKQLADVVESTAPESLKAVETPAAQGRSPLNGVVDIATGDDGGGGMGILLPAILLASLLGVIALVVMRRRAAS